MAVRILVDVSDVAGVQPSVFVDGRRGGLWLTQIAGHNLRAANEDLSPLARAEVLPVVDRHDSHLGIGHGGTDGGVRSIAPVPVGRRVGDRAGLGQPVPLGHHTAQTLFHRAAQLLAERCRS